jgi:hypothetical protein
MMNEDEIWLKGAQDRDEPTLDMRLADRQQDL